MRFYLKFINPVISIFIFFVCFWASATLDGGSQGNFNFINLFKGSFASYFFAKGIFTGLLIFLVGELFLFLIENKKEKTKTNNKFYILSLSLLIILIVFFILPVNIETVKDIFKKKEALVNKTYFENPKEVVIKNYYWIKESNYLSVGGIILNNSDFDWSRITVICEVYIGGRYSEIIKEENFKLTKQEEKKFIIKSSEFYNYNIKEKVSFKFFITGEK